MSLKASLFPHICVLFLEDFKCFRWYLKTCFINKDTSSLQILFWGIGTAEQLKHPYWWIWSDEANNIRPKMWKDEVDNDRGVNKELIGNYLTWNQMPIYLICYQAIAVGESEGVSYSVAWVLARLHYGWGHWLRLLIWRIWIKSTWSGLLNVFQICHNREICFECI